MSDDIADDFTDEIMIPMQIREDSSELLTNRSENDFRISLDRVNKTHESDGLNLLTKLLNIKQKIRKIFFMNICQILMHVLLMLLIIIVIIEAVNYIHTFAEKMHKIDFMALSDVSNKLRQIDFNKWNNDLNDIPNIKNTVSGYGGQVNKISKEVAEMLKIMKEFEIYINGTGVFGGGILDWINKLSGSDGDKRILIN